MDQLLAEASGVRIVLTSRVVVGHPQEWVFRVDGLSLESEDGTPSEAESLFRDRARKAGGTFDGLDSANEVVRICRLVDGMPLALELAASLARYLPLSAIAELLEEDAEAPFSASQSGLPSRHQSVYALFEESLLRLSASQRQSLSSLAVFDGPFDASAAAAVAMARLPELLSFADSSLLQPAGGRFRMHPLLRQFLQQSPARAPVRLPACPLLRGVRGSAASKLQGRGHWHYRRWSANHELIRPAVAAENHRANSSNSPARASSPIHVRGRFLRRTNSPPSLSIRWMSASNPELSPPAWNHAWSSSASAGLPRDGSRRRAMKLVYTEELEWLPGFGSDPRLVGVALRMGGGDYPGALSLARACLALAEKTGDAPGAAFCAWMAAAALIRMPDVNFERDADGALRLQVSRSDRSLGEAMGYFGPLRLPHPNDEVWLRGYVNRIWIARWTQGRPESAVLTTERLRPPKQTRRPQGRRAP